jgi:hypothetical protein
LIVGVFNAYALENVTGKVGVVYGPPLFDSQSQKYYLDVSLKNISKKDNLEFPLRLVVNSLSQSKASVYQPDGIDDTKKPYYLFYQDGKKSLAPGESVGPRRIFFSDMKPGKLNFTSLVQLSTTENTINNFVAALQMHDVDLALRELDPIATERYKPALSALLPVLDQFASDFGNRALVPISDVMAKYELRLQENGQGVIYDVYMYKNSKGEWKIFQM